MVFTVAGTVRASGSGTWTNPAAITTSALASTSGSTNLTWTGSAFSRGQEVRLTTTVPGGFNANTNYFVVYASGTTIRLATTSSGTPITATSTITNGTAQAYQSWQTAANWNPAAAPGGADAVVTFTNAPLANVPAVTLDASVTVGKILFTNTSTSASDLALISGSSAANTLTFAVSGSISGLAVPTVSMPTATTRLVNLGATDVLKVAGTQGLLVLAPTGGALTGSGLAATGSEPPKNFRVTNVDWSGFSGGVTVESGYFQANAAGQTPAQTLTLGDDTTVANSVLAGLVAGTAQSVGALAGNTNGRVQGAFTLTVGAGNGSGSFGGVVGRTFAGVATTTNLVKTGTGTQTLTGSVTGGGTVTVNGGTLVLGTAATNTYTGATAINQGGILLLDGTHTQGTGANAGSYTVAAGGVLGGTGQIVLSDASGTGMGISIDGELSPGDPAINGGLGTLTIDGGSSSRRVLAFTANGSLDLDLGTNFASDKVAVVNGQVNDVAFSNTPIDFNDTSGGVLYAGQYVLFVGDANTTYSGLTTNASGVITAGLTVHSGLEAYTGATLQMVGHNIVLNLSSPYNAPAVPLDSLAFGNSSSETAHGLSATGTTLDANGALGQTCRHVNPDTFLTATLAVNPSTKNYLTVKLWGGDTSTNALFLYKTGATTSLPSSNHYGFYNTIDGVYPDIMAPIYFNLAGVAPFPGRFYYVTFPIPSALINASTGTATIQLGEVGALSPYAAAGSQEGTPSGPSVGIYQIYTGTDPYFGNNAGETQGAAPAALIPATPASVSSTISTLRTACTGAIATVAGWQVYGSAWSSVTSSNSAGTASFSPVGAIYKGNNASSPPTLDQIAVQTSAGNAVNLRIPSYLAKAYVTSWSGHYHDTTYLDRVVKALDFCCLMQGSNGGLSVYNGTGTVWVGAPNRTTGGSPLEGYGTQGLGLAFDLIYAEAQKDTSTNTALQTYLNASISDGTQTLTRRQAWINLFNKNIGYLTTNGRGHASNQDLAQMTAMWLENQAAVSLGSTTGLTTAQAMQYVYSACGLAPSALNTTNPSLAGYWFSSLGLPLEAWGTLGGGYDGNYGIGSCVQEVSYLAELTGDTSVRQQALNAVHAASHFLFPSPNDSGYSSWRKEETISTRTLEWPGRVDFLNDGMPFAASPAGLNDPIAQRFTQVAYQNNDTITILASNDAHYVDSVGYALLNADSYAAALQAPASGTSIPTEAGQPDFAWVDPQGCTVAVQQTAINGDVSRLYVELEWRRGFSSNTTRDLTTAQVDGIARVHYTTPTMDRVVTANMDNPGGFGGLYACRYGPYFIAANLNTTNSASYTMPPDLWGKVGKNLVTGAAFVVPADGVIGVSYTNPLVYTVSAGPVIVANPTSAASAAGTTANLSVSASDNTGTAGLTYTWSVASTPPAPVTFSVNGSNSAAQTVATFSKAGNYSFTVTIANPAGATTVGTLNVSVNQVLTALALNPSAGSVGTGTMQRFSAVAADQFGSPMTNQPAVTWSVANGGTIDAATGLYYAPSTGTVVTIQAAGGGGTGTAQINVVDINSLRLGVVAPNAGGSQINITMPASKAGHSYQLQYSDSLPGGLWQNTGTPQAGTGGDMVFTVPLEATVSARFFRVQVQ